MASAISDELVCRAAAGDVAAIDHLLKIAQTDIRRYARRTCHSNSDAEEAVQETLIVLYRQVGSLRQVGAISGWLFRIVYRYCIRLTLKITGLPYDRHTEEIEKRFARVPQPELRIDIARAIESLPEHYRTIVIKRDIEEQTIDEIARDLNLTRESAKARLHRARTLLREYLIQEG